MANEMENTYKPGNIKDSARVRSSPSAGRLLVYIPLLVWALLTLFPFVWVLLTSFRTQSELYTNPFGLPAQWQLQNYADAWRLAQVPLYAKNSFFLVVLSTLMMLVLSAPAAYIFARIKFRFKSVLFGFVILGLFVPEAAILIPLNLMVRKLGMYDSLIGLAFIYAARSFPFTIFLMSSFMETLPREIEEAALMDGANIFDVFFKVILPLSLPAIATTATFHVLYVWNEYILAALMLVTPANRTLPLGIPAVQSQFRTNFPAYGAGMVMAFIPAMLFFLLLQRYVIKGLSAGAVKG